MTLLVHGIHGWAFQVSMATWVTRHMGSTPEKPLVGEREPSTRPPSRRSAPSARDPLAGSTERAGRWLAETRDA
ncbi:MAG: hypothetical protein ACYDEY_15400 [Acidimicrobiales bacterium]